MMKGSFTELVQDDLKLLSMRPGSFIKGTIMNVAKNWVTVDTGLKTEGVLPAEQFKNKSGEIEVSVGDEVELLLETVENGYGRTMVSYEKAKFFRLWKEYEEKYKANETVQGMIKNKIPGGFSVDLEGIKAFLPGSLIEIESNMDPKMLENTMTEFKIIKIDRDRYNLIVSHRAIGRQKLEDEKRTYFESLLQVGHVQGKVKQIISRGAFITLSRGVGFLRKPDIAWETVEDPHDYIKEGEEYDFKVLLYNKERNSLLLSLREMSEGPWEKISENYEIGQKIEGVIRHVNEHGLLVEIAPGLVGLVHNSELRWGLKQVNLADYGEPGDTIWVKILSMEPERRKLALSHRACLANPWRDYAEKHAIGEMVEGTVKDIQPFGIFVSLTEDIEGFIHPKNLDWNISPTDALKQYKKGQDIKSVITFIDVDSGKIMLNLRKTKPNYYLEYIAVHPINSLVTGKVKKIGKRSVIVELTENVDGNIPFNELSNNKMSSPEELINQDQELELQVVNYDSKRKSITLSMRRVAREEEKEALAEHQKKKGGIMGKLGDFFHLGADNKDAPEEAEQQNEGESKGKEKTAAAAAGASTGDDVKADKSEAATGDSDQETASDTDGDTDGDADADTDADAAADDAKDTDTDDKK